MWDITIQAQEVNNTPQIFRANKYSSCKLQARAQMAVSAFLQRRWISAL
jgi:hypothetical protein